MRRRARSRDGGANTNSPVPVQVSGGATDWASVSPGAKHTCALKTSGRLYCWGRDDSGELGNGNTTTTDQTVPDQVAGRRTDWASVAAGTSHTCARTTSHRLYCWGADFFGQLGNGPDVSGSQPVPVEVAGGGTRWDALDGGESHTCARKTNGRLYCWGEDRYGRLGDGGGETNAEAPVQVAGATRDWGRVSAGMDQTCARKTTGRLYCWGKDGNGQLGDGGTNDNQSAPSEVIG